jgi:hypothetical protein
MSSISRSISGRLSSSSSISSSIPQQQQGRTWCLPKGSTVVTYRHCLPVWHESQPGDRTQLAVMHGRAAGSF